jgi:hypothetical protein
MRHHTSQLARDGAVDSFRDSEVCWKENIKVALMNLGIVSQLILDNHGLQEPTKGVVTGTIFLWYRV